MRSFLVSIFGFPATLIHLDMLVLDRWLWLRNNLPPVSHGSKRLIDIGCGTGAFTIGAALRGYSKLMADISRCLKPGGSLLLTSPNYYYRPITKYGAGPFLPVEDGAHVRRGYTPERLQELCRDSGLKAGKIGYCSGFLSQKITGLQRVVARIHYLAGWAVILPLRVLPPLADQAISPLVHWPGYSITLVASKV